MTHAPIHFDAAHRVTPARIGAWVEALASKVLGPPSLHRIAADIRAGHIARYVEPGVRQVYMIDGVVHEARAKDGWIPRAID